MYFIKNLIKEPGTKVKNNAENNGDEEKKVKPVVKSASDLQRLKLEKLMKNPDKPVVIPEHRKEKDFMQSVPTFVRNVMGSSAGAGSGEFHVYRHLRRKEYARQKIIQSKSHQELLDEEYQQKLEENRKIAEEKTSRKRAKRLKKKNRAKKLKQSNDIPLSSEDGQTANDSESEIDNNSVNIEVENVTNASALNKQENV